MNGSATIGILTCEEIRLFIHLRHHRIFPLHKSKNQAEQKDSLLVRHNQLLARRIVHTWNRKNPLHPLLIKHASPKIDIIRKLSLQAYLRL